MKSKERSGVLSYILVIHIRLYTRVLFNREIPLQQSEGKNGDSVLDGSDGGDEERDGA